MGARHSKSKKIIHGIAGLDYIDVKNVPFIHDPEFGDAVHSKVLTEIEHYVAKKLLLEQFHLRGQEIEFLRSIFAMSKRELGKHLSLSHVAILKWEKARAKPLDFVNDLAVRVLMLDLLKIKVQATIEKLAPLFDIPKKFVLDYNEIKEGASHKKVA
jgi:DNA-binding transcriptional regulator YiaG